jgi:GT2 family glycosyltransferase
LSLSLSIIIINYKTPELTCLCLESIFKSSFKDFEILVVDNCSSDRSEEIITTKFPSIRWINNAENLGFGRANNIGASLAKGTYILLLNSDIVLQDNTLKVCVEHIHADKSIGVLGCKLLNEDLTLQKSVYNYVGDYTGILKYNLILDCLIKVKPSSTKAVMGAFMLIPKKIFEEVNGFDPDFFMYAEELDLCRRIKQKGYDIVYLDSVTATHRHGGSSEGSDWSGKQSYLSTALLYLKVKGYVGYFIYHFFMFFNFATNLLLLWKMDRTYRRDFWRGQKLYFSNYYYYIQIPFLYSKSTGHGKRILKRA